MCTLENRVERLVKAIGVMFFVTTTLAACSDLGFPVKRAYALVLEGCWSLAESELQRLKNEFEIDGSIDELGTAQPFHEGIVGVFEVTSRTRSEIELQGLMLPYWASCYPDSTLTIDRSDSRSWARMGEQYALHERRGVSRMFVKVTRQHLVLYMRDVEGNAELGNSAFLIARGVHEDERLDVRGW